MKFVHVFNEPLRRPNLTSYFLHDFSSAKIIWETWISLDQIYSAKKVKEKKTEVRFRDGHVGHV